MAAHGLTFQQFNPQPGPGAMQRRGAAMQPAADHHDIGAGHALPSVSALAMAASGMGFSGGRMRK